MRFRPIVLVFAAAIALLLPCVTAQFSFSVRALENHCQCDCCYSIGTRGRTECVSPTKTSFSVPSCSQCDVHQCADRFPTACSQPSSIVSTTCLAREGWMLRFVPYVFLVVTVLLILYGFFFKTFDGYHQQQSEPGTNRFQPSYQTFLPSYQSASPRVHAASPPLLSTILEDEEQPTDVRTATFPAATISSPNATDAFATSRHHVSVLVPTADTEQIDVLNVQRHQLHIAEYTPNNKESVSVTPSPRMRSGAPPVINKPDSANYAIAAQQGASHLVSLSAGRQAVRGTVPHVQPTQKHPESDVQPQHEDVDHPDPFPTSHVTVAERSVDVPHVRVDVDTALAALQTVDKSLQVSATPTGNNLDGDRESGAVTNTLRDVTVAEVAETVSPVQGIETKQDEVAVSGSDPSHEAVDEPIQDSFPLASSPVTEGMAPIDGIVPQTEGDTETDARREESTPEDQTQGSQGNAPAAEAFERDAYLSGVKEAGVDAAEKSMNDETESGRQGHPFQTHEAPEDGPSTFNTSTVDSSQIIQSAERTRSLVDANAPEKAEPDDDGVIATDGHAITATSGPSGLVHVTHAGDVDVGKSKLGPAGTTQSEDFDEPATKSKAIGESTDVTEADESILGAQSSESQTLCIAQTQPYEAVSDSLDESRAGREPEHNAGEGEKTAEDNRETSDDQVEPGVFGDTETAVENGEESISRDAGNIESTAHIAMSSTVVRAATLQSSSTPESIPATMIATHSQVKEELNLVSEEVAAAIPRGDKDETTPDLKAETSAENVTEVEESDDKNVEADDTYESKESPVDDEKPSTREEAEREAEIEVPVILEELANSENVHGESALNVQSFRNEQSNEEMSEEPNALEDSSSQGEAPNQQAVEGDEDDEMADSSMHEPIQEAKGDPYQVSVDVSNEITEAGMEDHSELPAEDNEEVQQAPLSSTNVAGELSEDHKAKDEASREEDGEPSDTTVSDGKDAILEASSSAKENIQEHEELTPSDRLGYETVVDNEALLDSTLIDKTNPAAERLGEPTVAESEPVNDISAATRTRLVEESSLSEAAKSTEGDTTTPESELVEQPTPVVGRQTEDPAEETKNEGSDIAELGAMNESCSAGDVEPTDEAAAREELETVEESHIAVDAAQNDKASESIESTPVKEPSDVQETEPEHAVSSETEIRGIGIAATELHPFESPSVVSEADQIAETQSQQLEEQRALIVGAELTDELSAAAKPEPVAEQPAAVETAPEVRVLASGESENAEESSVVVNVEPIGGTPVGDESAPVDDATSSTAVESKVARVIKAEEVHESVIVADSEPVNESFEPQPTNEAALAAESEPVEEPSAVAELVQTAAASTEAGSEPEKEEPVIVDAHPVEELTAETESEQIEQPSTAVEGEQTEEPSTEAELVPAEESSALAEVQQRAAALSETEPELVEEERAAVNTNPAEEPTTGAELEHTEKSSTAVEGEPAEVPSVAAELVPVEELTAVGETEAKAAASDETEAELAEDQYAATEPTVEVEPADEACAVAGESAIVDEEANDSPVADESETVHGPPEAVQANPSEKDIAANESEPVAETPTAPEFFEEGELGDVETGVTTATVLSEIPGGAELEDQPGVDDAKNSDTEVVETGDGEVAVASETVTNLESVPALDVQDDSFGEQLGDSKVAEEAAPRGEAADTGESEDVANTISESNIVSDTDLDGNDAATLNTTGEAYPTEGGKNVDTTEALQAEAPPGDAEGEVQVQVGYSTEATATEPESHEQDDVHDVHDQALQLMLNDSEFELVQSMTGDTLQRSESRQEGNNVTSTDNVGEGTVLEGASGLQGVATSGQASASAAAEHDSLLGTDATDVAIDGVEPQTVETDITDRDEAISTMEVTATGDSLKLMEENSNVGDTVGEQPADAAPQGGEVVMHVEENAIGDDNDYTENDNTGIDENTRGMGDDENEEDTDMYDESDVVGGTERKDVPEDNFDAGDEGIAVEDSGGVGVVQSSPSGVDPEAGDEKVAEE